MIEAPKYKQILRINPETSPEIMRKFKEVIRCTNEQGFDLNGIKEEPPELLERTYGEIVSTSSAARKKSRELCKKYRVDNIQDWRKLNWFGAPCNVNSNRWINEFTVYLESEDNLCHVMVNLATLYKVEMYFSFVEDSTTYFEDNCGLLKIKETTEYFELGFDRFERFVLGIVLKYGIPLSFELWEGCDIPMKNGEIFYNENFLELNARERMEEAFNHSNHICLANTMVNEEIGPERVWAALSQLF